MCMSIAMDFVVKYTKTQILIYRNILLVIFERFKKEKIILK